MAEDKESGDDKLADRIAWSLLNVVLLGAVLTFWIGIEFALVASLVLAAAVWLIISLIATGRGLEPGD